MSLHLPLPPVAVRRIVRTALESTAARRASRIPALAAAGELTADHPLELYRLDLASRGPSRAGSAAASAAAPPLAAASVPSVSAASAPAPARVRGDTAGLLAARPVGWRFAVHRGDEPVAAVETMDTPDGAAFRHFSSGPFVASALRALAQARLLPQVRAGRHEPRLLSVPDLYMMALWLHPAARKAGADGSAPRAPELLVPLAPAPPGIAAHRPHRAQELVPVLAERAALRLLAGTA